MLLLIMCCDLEVADRRMTPAIKLVFAQAFVSGSTSLVRQLMGDRMFHYSAFAQGSPATLRLHLRAQLLLELFVLADAQASPVPVRGSGTLSTQGARIVRRRRTLGLPAWDHRDALPPGQVTCILAQSNVQSCLVKSGPLCGQGRAIM
jgi:hypothetical protein